MSIYTVSMYTISISSVIMFIFAIFLLGNHRDIPPPDDNTLFVVRIFSRPRDGEQLLGEWKDVNGSMTVLDFKRNVSERFQISLDNFFLYCERFGGLGYHVRYRVDRQPWMKFKELINNNNGCLHSVFHGRDRQYNFSHWVLNWQYS